MEAHFKPALHMSIIKYRVDLDFWLLGDQEGIKTRVPQDTKVSQESRCGNKVQLPWKEI